jgi:hypothetical protein
MQVTIALSPLVMSFSATVFQNVEEVLLDVSTQISREHLAIVSYVDKVNSIVSHSPVESTCI